MPLLPINRPTPPDSEAAARVPAEPHSQTPAVVSPTHTPVTDGYVAQERAEGGATGAPHTPNNPLNRPDRWYNAGMHRAPATNGLLNSPRRSANPSTFAAPHHVAFEYRMQSRWSPDSTDDELSPRRETPDMPMGDQGPGEIISPGDPRSMLRPASDQRDSEPVTRYYTRMGDQGPGEIVNPGNTVAADGAQGHATSRFAGGTIGTSGWGSQPYRLSLPGSSHRLADVLSGTTQPRFSMSGAVHPSDMASLRASREPIVPWRNRSASPQRGTALSSSVPTTRPFTETPTRASGRRPPPRRRDALDFTDLQSMPPAYRQLVDAGILRQDATIASAAVNTTGLMGPPATLMGDQGPGAPYNAAGAAGQPSTGSPQDARRPRRRYVLVPGVIAYVHAPSASDSVGRAQSPEPDSEAEE